MRTNRLRHLSTSLPGRLQRSCADHQRLCEAYAERDGTLAAALNRSIVMSALCAIEQAWTTEHGAAVPGGAKPDDQDAVIA
jgi:DNA-binding GntR family transcriptional regulator